MTSAVLILPAAYLDLGNAFGAAHGWGEGTFSVGLSADGAGAATYWGCRADVSDLFVEMIENPAPESAPLVSVLLYSFSDTLAPYDHWIETLATCGLRLLASDRL